MDTLEPQLQQLLTYSGAGLGAIMLAVVRMFSQRSSVWFGAVATASLVAGVMPMSLYDIGFSWNAFGLVLGGALLATLFASPLMNRLAQSLRRPAVGSVSLLLLGLVTIGASVVRFSEAENTEFELQDEWLAAVTVRPETIEIDDRSITTDLGRRLRPHRPVQPRSHEEMIEAENHAVRRNPFSDKLIRRGPASDDCNCHGWVFTGGKYWLSTDDVSAILEENGYEPVSDPKPGDVVIYYQGKSIAHTAIVRATGPNVPVMVEGKWGCMGVYLHGVDDSCYGRQYTYYRANRDSHVVVGLGGKAHASMQVPVHELEKSTQPITE